MIGVVTAHYRYKHPPSTKVALWASHHGERKRM